VNPSTALATALVDQLVRCGVREVVVCPGSRSAPLAYAVQQAERAGRLRMHVRVDERSAGFLALGLAKLSRVPAAVVTTSGTAVANLHPAVLEAHHGVVPLLVLSADRPAGLRGTGANQTTAAQHTMFGSVLRWSVDLPAPAATAEPATAEPATPEPAPGETGWRAVARHAFDRAAGEDSAEPGPVHLNLQFREPLVPTDDPAWPAEADPDPLEESSGESQRPPGLLDEVAHTLVVVREPADNVARTLVVIGDLPDARDFGRALRWARSHGWPVVAEPFGTHPREGVVPHGPLLLTAPGWVDAHAPERVITVGRVTLSRPVAALLRRPATTVEAVRTHRWIESVPGVARTHDPGVLDQLGEGPADPAWSAAWDEAADLLAKAVADALASWPSGRAVAGVLLDHLPEGATLFLGSSNSVRDVDLASAGRVAELLVTANRGLAGIDGCVSTAVGIALAGDRPAYALMGDLTFLHDSGGLTIGPHEPRPDLTLVVVNDDGGGIFTLLEPGEPARAADFERVFGTPTGADLAALCAAHGVRHRLAATAAALAAAVAEPPKGITVVEVRVDRAGHRAARARLHEVAAAALAPPQPDRG
jgi:2-succinyl-5-enolpyruvyl-6-hydroxy-3-cyclohexene-1-carboxylate synthase